MRPESICVRKLAAALALLLVLLPPFGGARANAAADAAGGYETIRPSLVKVWAFDRNGKPSSSGTGVIVESNDRRSLVLTASHVVSGAASVRIDVSRELHDVAARVQRAGPRDLTLLTIERGHLRAATFAPRTRAVVEGNLVAVAGYVKNDELIGVVGQAPRILFPGTVAARPDNGQYLELENVHIEEGLSGGPVFDPATGDVLGIVTSRTSDRRGGFADSGALVVLPFLAANPLRGETPALPPYAHAAIQAGSQIAVVEKKTTVAVALPALGARTVQNVALLATPPAVVARPASEIASWQVANGAPKRFAVVRGTCRVAVTIDVRTLQFIIAHQALVAPHRRGALLSIALQQRAGAAESCANVPDTEPADGAYEPTAMAFDGKHVTMRFSYAGSPANEQFFPADASLDADLQGDTATATVQFFDRDWTGSIALQIARTPLAAVSSSW